MQYKEGSLFFSASDLTAYLDSPFASWMDRYALECPGGEVAPDEIESMDRLLFAKGYKHESEVEAALQQEFDTFIAIDGKGDAEKIANTRAALEAGIDVVTQACFRVGQFFGYADFLIKVPGKSRLGDYHYEVWDAKLSKRAKPSHALQLCLYVDMLESIQGRKPDRVVVALGSGERHPIPLSECYAYYQSVREDFLAVQEQFDPNQQPDPAAFNSWGRWSDYAKEILLERDHLYQVANITREQIKKLNRVGIETMAGLAATSVDKVPGIGQPVFERLKVLICT
ncbi:putative RecB family nuclease [Litorivivens lipolytica]|uniref:Putative RecB family nuclease n=1 Tax=Litorivivens lipolytica TaxID=1524264 RepID=A0A7W4W8M2_9GAMM|nr:hypothetical protein [Litorivivens lipolytica]MBB3049003.1 putative RecB family nuclease [Litorivivens lipolytica]